VKAHPSHPETSRRCAALIAGALAAAGAPDGMFALVEGASIAVGTAFVLAPEISAVAFTGSRRGGRALYDLAATRPVPIPVYAEMGSVNPVFVTGAALATRGDAIADGLAASMLNGTGQFCTSPGVVVVSTGADGDRFVERVASAVTAAPPGHMLNETIRNGLVGQLADTTRVAGVATVAIGERAPDGCADRAGREARVERVPDGRGHRRLDAPWRPVSRDNPLGLHVGRPSLGAEVPSPSDVPGRRRSRITGRAANLATFPFHV
jgi:acyl-CoA reductase-like NAD-dependent aldehyde dehydrogenase